MRQVPCPAGNSSGNYSSWRFGIILDYLFLQITPFISHWSQDEFAQHSVLGVRTNLGSILPSWQEDFGRKWVHYNFMHTFMLRLWLHRRC